MLIRRPIQRTGCGQCGGSPMTTSSIQATHQARRVQSGSAFASYLHVHFAQRPTMLNHWLQAARRTL
jgi:cobyrinic acid a,c-diamide synthase